MKIFITGIAGFLGSHIADSLISLGQTVSGCDNLIGGHIDNVPNDAEFFHVDCNDLDAMKKHLDGVDIVYHTACTAYEGFSVFSPSLVTLNTYQNTASIATAAINCNVRRFIHCSSMARYGAQEKVPFTEDMVPIPQDPYGISKLAAENLLQCLSGVHGMELVILVPHNIIGPRQKYDDPYRNVASIMINMMLQHRQPIIFGDGTQKRCFSFVQDVIDCLAKAAFQDNVVGEIINVGPDEEFITIYELAKTIAELLDFELEPVYMPGRPLEVRYATCSANKARELMNYQTVYTLREGLTEMIQYIKARGVKRFRYHLDLEIINDKTPLAWTDKLF